MKRVTLGFFTLSASAALLLGCDSSNRVLAPSDDSADLARKSGGQTETITLVKLPSLGSNSEALAIDEAGTVITGDAFDRAGYLYAVKWTLQGGSWVISTLPYPATAEVSTGVDNQGNAVGRVATGAQQALLWPAAGGSTLLDCPSDVGASQARAISADGQVVAGNGGSSAVVWRPAGASTCRELLPGLEAGSTAGASSVNGVGSIVGGSAFTSSGIGMPVRWRMLEAGWQIELLDSRAGSALGANGAGDLAGYVRVPCAQTNGCGHAYIWNADGTSLDISANVGAEQSFNYDVNSSGEAVGVGTPAHGASFAYLWSAAAGLRQLAAKGSDGSARAVSDVRADGTRLVVGVASASAAVWVVRNP